MLATGVADVILEERPKLAAEQTSFRLRCRFRWEAARNPVLILLAVSPSVPPFASAACLRHHFLAAPGHRAVLQTSERNLWPSRPFVRAEIMAWSLCSHPPERPRSRQRFPQA